MSMWLGSFPQGHSGATVGAIILYCVVTLAVLNSRFADAAGLKPCASENQSELSLGDGNARFPFTLEAYNGLVLEDVVDESGEPRGLDLIRRAPTGSSALANNQHKTGIVKLGEIHWWYFPKDAWNGKTINKTSEGQDHDNSKRSTAVYLSLTTCSKPNFDKSDSGHVPALPQLEVYISTSESLQRPGPGGDSRSQSKVNAEDGYMRIATQVQGDVYVGVAAPNNSDYSGSYSYEIAASVDGYYHNVDDEDDFLHFLDTDMKAALLTTKNLTDLSSPNTSSWLNMTPRYTIFVSSFNDTAISGLHRSYCALDRHAQIGKDGVEVSMTTRGMKPKEQFFITGLNRSSVYTAILAMDGNSTRPKNGSVGGGGKVWKPLKFTTKADQIQCDAPSESRFSLAVGCDDCGRAYKQWLCAVTIPRCTDFSSTDKFLQVRNAGQKFINGSSLSGNDPLLQSPVTNQSRNSLIDSQVRPGPYKEVLPCQDVCYNLAMSCPAALGFSCPDGNWLNASYGTRSEDIITCNYPGAENYLNGARDSYQSLWTSFCVIQSHSPHYNNCV
ncbi:hypothetical protein EYZ11_007887 [Aspergillus tanneri]|uniref:Stretch-activated cation channel mid1 n=1 Tax=Aspergillus tanneri TaxID=1220188 RepID=A0A4S3JC17_9EURO|nr:hypothetical protein EYZ11_007887 [Aspergillus tanneri]